jgi:hypothetical protein
VTYWKTPEFKSLQQAWYQRLADAGFSDIEELVGEDLEMRQMCPSTHYCFRRTDEDDRYLTSDYYTLLAAKIDETQFRSEVHKIILTSYVSGKKASEICEELKQRGTPRHRHAIRFIVRRYEAKWQIREWSPTQLGKKVG